MDTRFRKSFFDSFTMHITIAIKGGIFKQIFYKINNKFLRYVCPICPKTFAKTDILPQMGVAYFALKIF